MPELQHNRRMVKNLALITEANAALHFKSAAEQLGSREWIQRPAWSQHEMLAASGFAVAASYWSLLDAERAVTLYRRAAETYRQLNHGYAMALALASATSDEISITLASMDEASPPSPQTVAFALVANELSDSEAQGSRVERLGLQWRHFGNVPIGRLGIPLDYYGRCALAMRAARQSESEEGFLAQASDYVRRAAEVLKTASHDQFNWLALQSSILPAEPEAVAMTAAMSMVSHSLFGMPISQMPNLDEHGRLLAEVGDALRKAGGSSKDKPPEENPPKNNPPRNNPPRNRPRNNPPMVSA
jgi:hypothetical protein